MQGKMAPSDKTVLVLFFTLVILIALLVFLYKKLNKEANNEYTIRQIVYKEGGVRDRVRGVALTAERHLGIQLWPQSDEDEEEMQEVQDEERDVEAGDSQQGSDGSDTDGEDEEEEDSMDRSGSTKEKDGNSSCGESSGAGEEDRLMSDKPEEKEEVASQSEEKQEKEVKEEGKAEASGGTGLLIDLKQFSGSAIWSEEGGGEGQGADVTAL
ncbi:protein gar2 isoform X1 [Fundulus heteroclitus]|uniref:protein gar2 isoform X1 n=2 Tax=Fundulus heteroclitus TaxID=8078 RepID=UPI000644B694|nr:protein gar2 isoform X1 [Fundulus heteroclitus]